MQYWLNLFTGSTWKEFQASGATISGFRERMRVSANKVSPGDVLLCYLTGVKRWVGALKVVGPSEDKSHIWKLDEFPVRFEVEPLILLPPEHGVPMEHLEGKVSFFAGPRERGKYNGFVRMSPNRFRDSADAELILGMLREAATSPVSRPFDEKKLLRTPTYKVEKKRGRKMVQACVTVPEPETLPLPIIATEEEAARTRHTEMQHHLLRLGVDMGLDVWVARNDRGRSWRGHVLGDMPHMLSEVPTQFNDATNRTIELIDVLWLRGNSIVAAFEVECTTSIYSGLLRMSDLLALQPNLEIKLYLVAPDERREKVQQEIRRPTFALRERSLPEICGFLSFSSLMEKVEGIRKLGLAGSLKPDFLESTAEYFTGLDI